jgi:hypothetical protein
MTTGGDAPPPSLELVLQSIPRVGAPRREDDSWVVPLVRKQREIDLSALDSDINLILEITFDRNLAAANNRFEIKNLKSDGHLHVRTRFTGGPKASTTSCAVTLTNVVGHVVLDGDDLLTVAQFSSKPASLQLGPGHFGLSVDGDTPADVKMTNDVDLELRTSVRSVTLPERCALRIEREVKIESIEVGSVAEVAGVEVLSVATLNNQVGGQSQLIFVTANTRANVVSVTAGTLADVVVGTDGRKPLALRIGEHADNVTVKGAAHVTIKEKAFVRRLISQGHVDLTAGYSAVLTELGGQWIIRSVAGASLGGGKEGFEISGTRARGRNESSPFDSASLGRFRLGDPSTRRQILAELDSAYFLDPLPDHLPGAGPAYHERRPWRWRLDADRERALSQDAEFVRELARQAREHGAPGSTRTLVAWCAYRLRHLASGSWWERRALDGYRLLGYGERPGPAFLSWIVLAAVCAGATLGFTPDPTADGLLRFLGAAIQQALGPVGSLFGTGTPDAEWWTYALRTLVAIPLITGALALRNYVKQDHR